MTKLKVYLTTYNRAKYLERAVRSVLDQTYRDFNLTILDNCSTDNTKETVEQFLSDERVTYSCHEKNIGSGNNIRIGFRQDEGEFFCILHDDDICHPTMFEEEINYLETHEDCCAVSCIADNIDPDDRVIRRHPIREQGFTEFSGTEFFNYYLSSHNSLIFPATMYRRSFIRDNGIIITDEPGPCADVVLYMDIEKEGGKLAEINKNLFSTRTFPEQDSSSNLEKMLVSLMEYLKGDDYYGKLFREAVAGRKSYFKWYGRILIVRTASQCISADSAKEYLKKMNKVLGSSTGYYVLIKSVILLEKMFPKAFLALYKRSVTKRERSLA